MVSKRKPSWRRERAGSSADEPGREATWFITMSDLRNLGLVGVNIII